MTGHLPEDLDEQLEIVRGRKAPYTTVPDWVSIHADLDPQAKALYNVLAAHVNTSRDDTLVWPTRLSLAEMLGFSREQSVDKYIKQLVAVGAIDTEEIRRPNGSKGVLYTVHQTPPGDYDGPQTLSAWYARRRAALAAEGPKRKPGRPRKTAAPAATPAAGGTSAAPAEEVPDETAAKPSAKKPPAKKTAAKKTPPEEKSRAEVALDEVAKKAADGWWEELTGRVEKGLTGPLMGTPRAKSGYYLNLRTRIREAFAAGYTKHEVWKALCDLGEWSPAKREFDHALRRARGIPPPARGRHRPIYQAQQWKTEQGQEEPTAPEQEAGSAAGAAAPPDLDAFGVEAQPARA
ncbi:MULTISPECIES: hypothetical protein [unclassified Streptomyces]|uniref:hypothetical protein n=1 Tax=unclassified Streptomyces TaxID=2593676 RepID=UPI00333105C7